MKQFFVHFIWRPGGADSNRIILADEYRRYTWNTKTSLTGFATLLKAKIENIFEGVSVELRPVDMTTDMMVIADSLEIWDIKNFAREISRTLAISEFIDKQDWHEPDEVVE